MTIQCQQQRVRVGRVRSLSGAWAPLFCQQIQAALPGDCVLLEVDLSETTRLDSAGVAALVTLYGWAQRRARAATLRLVGPQPAVRQILDLTQLSRLWEVSDPAAERHGAEGGPSDRITAR